MWEVNKQKHLLLLYAFVCLILAGCSKKNSTTISSNMFGKEVVIPDSIEYLVKYRNDTSLFSENLLNIIHFVKATECTSCRLKLPLWKIFSEKIDSISQGRVKTTIIVQPKSRKELVSLVEIYDYNFDVLIDAGHKFDKLNLLPDDNVYHSFMVNCNNEIVAIGNPIENRGIEELFLSVVKNVCSLSYSHIIEKDVVSGDFEELNFVIRNLTCDTIKVNRFVTSCDCLHLPVSEVDIFPQDSVPVPIAINISEKGIFYRNVEFYTTNYPNIPYILHLYGNCK